MLSVPLDFSLVADNFVGLFEAVGFPAKVFSARQCNANARRSPLRLVGTCLLQGSGLARVTKFAKLSARAVRLSRQCSFRKSAE